jgi:methionyl-tRNA formyltransferase
MKLLLLADGSVGEQVLSYLVREYPQDVAAVVTVADRGLQDIAVAAGFQTLVYHSGPEFERQLEDAAPAGGFDLGFMAWWPHVIPGGLLSVPRQGFLNMHPSLLPYNRGKHYNFWALVEQCPFGVTIHCVERKIDAGDIVAQRAITYDWTDTGETLYHKAQATIVALFEDVYADLRMGKFARTPQDISAGSFHNARELEQASQIELDGTYRARDLLNLLRARTFPGYPACQFTDEGKRYEVRIDIKRIDDV